jgi:hypothetical protein
MSAFDHSSSPPTRLADPADPAVWREADIVVVRRDRPLPPLCLFTGQPAEQRVACLFHWNERPMAGGGFQSLLQHYWQNVWKAKLDIPLAPPLMARRKIGWLLFALTAVMALVMIGGVVGIQVYIASLPDGPTKKQWKDMGPPVAALGGFVLTAIPFLASYKIMPMPTVRLKPVRITSEQVWLAGAAKEYLDQIPSRTIS